jgi:hypothetical protein
VFAAIETRVATGSPTLKRSCRSTPVATAFRTEPPVRTRHVRFSIALRSLSRISSKPRLEASRANRSELATLIAAPSNDHEIESSRRWCGKSLTAKRETRFLILFRMPKCKQLKTLTLELCSLAAIIPPETCKFYQFFTFPAR